MTINDPKIRVAVPGDEPGIHEAHMRSIREICVKDHGEEEVKGWGNRPLGTRWINPIKDGFVWVVELRDDIHGFGYIGFSKENNEVKAHIYGLYLTPEVVGKGVGFKLMGLMIHQAKKMGVKSITLGASLTAHGFYKKFGFRDSGPMYYADIGGSAVRGFPMVLDI